MNAFWTYFLSPVLSFLTNFYSEIFLAQLLFAIVLPKRKHAGWILGLWLASNLGLYFVPNLYSLSGFFTINGRVNLIFPLVVVLSSVFFYCFSQTGVREVVFYSIAAYAMQNFAHDVTLLSNALLGYGYRQGLGLVMEFAILIASDLVFYFLFASRVRRGENTAIQNGYLIILSAVTLVVTYLLSSLFLPASSDNVLALFYAAICSLFLLFLQFSVFDQSQVEKDKQTIEELWHNEQKQYTLWKANVDIINVKCHDLKHQISAIRQMRDGKEQEKGLAQIEDAVLLYDGVAKTGNETLDVLLTEKIQYCESNHIKFSYIVDGGKLTGMSELDLCSLFGNALDNAIEGVKKIGDFSHRLISLNVYGQGQLLTIHVDNTYAGDIRMVGSLPVTSKDDANYHGFGIKSMAMIVEKYGGNLLIRPENGIFNLDILLPLDEKGEHCVAH